MPKSVRSCLLVKALLATAMLGSAATSQAATIVDISPNSGSSFHVGGSASQVETISWTQTITYTGVNISALVGNVGTGSETVDAYLTTAIGPTAGSPIATANVAVSNFATGGDITSASLFSGLTLNPGSYYLTLFNPDTTGNVNVRWAGGSSTTFGTGVSGNGEYFANLSAGIPDTTNPWMSTFVTSGSYNDGFTVTGTAVPEPSTLSLALASLVAFGIASRSRHRVPERADRLIGKGGEAGD